MTNTDLTQLEQRVTELRTQPIPSLQFVDALNTWAQALSPIDITRALTISKEAYKLACLLQDHMGMAVSMARLSWLHLESGMFDVALLEAKQARSMAKQLHDYTLFVRSIYVLALAYEQAGNFKQAETLLQSLASLAHENGDRLRQADFLVALGKLYGLQHDFVHAYDYYRQSHAMYVELADVTHIFAKNNMAYALTMRGRYVEALEWVQQSIQLCDPRWQVWRALFVHTLGAVHVHLGEYDLALVEFNESLAMSRLPAGRKETAVQVLLDLARLELLGNRMAPAYEALKQASALAVETKSVPQQTEAHRLLFRISHRNRTRTR